MASLNEMNGICLSTETQIAVYLSSASDGDGVHEALISVTKDVDPNIDSQSVENVSRQNGLNWRMFQEEAVESLDFEHFVEFFGAVDGVDDQKWKTIYDAMKEHDAESGDVMARKHLCMVHMEFYKKWLSKC